MVNFLGKPYYIFQNKNDLNEFIKLGVKENFKLIKGSGVNHKEFIYSAPITKTKNKYNFYRKNFKGQRNC